MADTVTSVGQSASDLQTSYLKLLVTQLQNQNPLDPVDNNQMTAQLAQLSQLSQIEQLNQKFSDVVASSQRSYANALIGKTVSYVVRDSSGNLVTDDAGNNQLAGGIVNGVITQGDSILLQVGNSTVDLNDIQAVI